MKSNSSLKEEIKFFAMECAMVFLGVLLAFWVNDWAEERKNKEYTESILFNLSQDIRSDSARICATLDLVTDQYNNLDRLINHLASGKYDSARTEIIVCYRSLNVFEPTTESYQSMIFGGDLKLFRDYEIIRVVKEIDKANQRVNDTHALYHRAVEEIRNTFICKEDMASFNLKNFQNKQEFWNRLNFLRSTYLKNYRSMLLDAQASYHNFLQLDNAKRSL